MASRRTLAGASLYAPAPANHPSPKYTASGLVSTIKTMLTMDSTGQAFTQVNGIEVTLTQGLLTA